MGRPLHFQRCENVIAPFLPEGQADRMSCRAEILEVAQILKTRRPDGTFTVRQVLEEMSRRGTTYQASTIRGDVGTKMCRHAPKSSATHYPDLERVATSIYRLA